MRLVTIKKRILGLNLNNGYDENKAHLHFTSKTDQKAKKIDP